LIPDIIILGVYGGRSERGMGFGYAARGARVDVVWGEVSTVGSCVSIVVVGVGYVFGVGYGRLGR
jgi:hypothetical protein